MERTGRLQGKVALITGASRGIGRALALAFAREGAQLSLWGRSMRGLNSAVREIGKERSTRQGVTDAPKLWRRSAGSRDILPLSVDVSKERNVTRGVERVLNHFQKVDILVNNAGFAAFKSVLETPVEDWDRMMAVNLRGAFLSTKAVLPSMLKRRKGDIVLMASIAGREGFPEWSGYCASKFGLVGFAKSLAKEVRRKGVRVITVCPGAVDTSLWKDHPNPPDPKEMLKPEEVAEAVLDLLTFSNVAVIDEVVITPRKGIL